MEITELIDKLKAAGQDRDARRLENASELVEDLYNVMLADNDKMPAEMKLTPRQLIRDARLLAALIVL